MLEVLRFCIPLTLYANHASFNSFQSQSPRSSRIVALYNRQHGFSHCGPRRVAFRFHDSPTRSGHFGFCSHSFRRLQRTENVCTTSSESYAAFSYAKPTAAISSKLKLSTCTCRPGFGRFGTVFSIAVCHHLMTSYITLQSCGQTSPV